MVRTKLKNLLNGSVQEKSFRTSEKFPEPDVEIATVSFLYNDGEGFHFMDQSTYEQFMLPADTVGDDRFYLKEGLNLEIFKYNGNAVSLQLPQYVELLIMSTEPGVRGDTAAGGRVLPSERRQARAVVGAVGDHAVAVRRAAAM